MVFKQKGIPAGNTFLESLTEKFNGNVSNFVLGNAESLRGYPIVYCSDGFCQLTGYSRHEVLGNSCNCMFLYSIDTQYQVKGKIAEALNNAKELKTEINLAKKDGSTFFCILDIIPIRNEEGEVVLFLVSHKQKQQQNIDTDDLHGKEHINGNACSESQPSKSRKFSRDVLVHLQKRYQGLTPTPASAIQSERVLLDSSSSVVGRARVLKVRNEGCLSVYCIDAGQ